MKRSEIIDTLSPLLNHYMWKMNFVHGSIIGLYFGNVSLSIREPTYPKNVEKRLFEKYSHRLIAPIGEYYFSTMFVDWKMKTKFHETNSDDVSFENYQPIFSQLSGQILIDITFEGDWLVFTFDLGGELRFNMDENAYEKVGSNELWTYSHKGNHATYVLGEGLKHT